MNAAANVSVMLVLLALLDALRVVKGSPLRQTGYSEWSVSVSVLRQPHVERDPSPAAPDPLALRYCPRVGGWSDSDGVFLPDVVPARGVCRVLLLRHLPALLLSGNGLDRGDGPATVVTLGGSVPQYVGQLHVVAPGCAVGTEEAAVAGQVRQGVAFGGLAGAGGLCHSWSPRLEI
jgi:hypothetical protein